MATRRVQKGTLTGPTGGTSTSGRGPAPISAEEQGLSVIQQPRPAKHFYQNDEDPHGAEPHHYGGQAQDDQWRLTALVTPDRLQKADMPDSDVVDYKEMKRVPHLPWKTGTGFASPDGQIWHIPRHSHLYAVHDPNNGPDELQRRGWVRLRAWDKGLGGLSSDRPMVTAEGRNPKLVSDVVARQLAGAPRHVKNPHVIVQSAVENTRPGISRSDGHPVMDDRYWTGSADEWHAAGRPGVGHLDSREVMRRGGLDKSALSKAAALNNLSSLNKADRKSLGFYQDNPALDPDNLYAKRWLQDNPKGMTGVYHNVRVPVAELLKLPGVKGEHTKMDHPWMKQRVNELTESMKQNGYHPDHPVQVQVDNQGRPAIYEGNKRTRAAQNAGITHVPVHMWYEGGAEELPGVWDPANFQDDQLQKAFNNLPQDNPSSDCSKFDHDDSGQPVVKPTVARPVKGVVWGSSGLVSPSGRHFALRPNRVHEEAFNNNNGKAHGLTHAVLHHGWARVRSGPAWSSQKWEWEQNPRVEVSSGSKEAMSHALTSMAKRAPMDTAVHSELFDKDRGFSAQDMSLRDHLDYLDLLDSDDSVVKGDMNESGLSSLWTFQSGKLVKSEVSYTYLDEGSLLSLAEGDVVVRRIKLPKSLREQILGEKPKCHWCGYKGAPLEFDVDHVTPVKHGGLNDVDNLVPSCSTCNRSRGAKLADEDPVWSRKSQWRRMAPDKKQEALAQDMASIHARLRNLLTASLDKAWTPPTKKWMGMDIDAGLNPDHMERLNGVPGINVVSTCAGHPEVHSGQFAGTSAGGSASPGFNFHVHGKGPDAEARAEQMANMLRDKHTSVSTSYWRGPYGNWVTHTDGKPRNDVFAEEQLNAHPTDRASVHVKSLHPHTGRNQKLLHRWWESKLAQLEGHDLNKAGEQEARAQYERKFYQTEAPFRYHPETFTKPGTHIAYRASPSGVEPTPRGLFFSADYSGAHPYATEESGPPKAYRVTVNKPAVFEDVWDAAAKTFGGTRQQWHDKLENAGVRYARGGPNRGGGKNAFWQNLDKRLQNKLRAAGHDAITYLRPNPPATRELQVIHPKVAIEHAPDVNVAHEAKRNQQWHDAFRRDVETGHEKARARQKRILDKADKLVLPGYHPAEKQHPTSQHNPQSPWLKTGANVGGAGKRYRVPKTATVKVYHGTNSAFADKIRQEGFKPTNPRSISNLVEDTLKLPRGAVYNHPHFEFSRSRGEAKDPHRYFTTDPKTAERYAKVFSEPVDDALRAAYHYKRGWTAYGEGDSARHSSVKEDRFIDAAKKRLGWTPQVLEAELPYDMVRRSLPKPLKWSEFQHHNKISPINTLMIGEHVPPSMITNAIKWHEEGEAFWPKTFANVPYAERAKDESVLHNHPTRIKGFSLTRPAQHQAYVDMLYRLTHKYMHPSKPGGEGVTKQQQLDRIGDLRDALWNENWEKALHLSERAITPLHTEIGRGFPETTNPRAQSGDFIDDDLEPDIAVDRMSKSSLFKGAKYIHHSGIWCPVDRKHRDAATQAEHNAALSREGNKKKFAEEDASKPVLHTQNRMNREQTVREHFESFSAAQLLPPDDKELVVSALEELPMAHLDLITNMVLNNDKRKTVAGTYHNEGKDYVRETKKRFGHEWRRSGAERLAEYFRNSKRYEDYDINVIPAKSYSTRVPRNASFRQLDEAEAYDQERRDRNAAEGESPNGYYIVAKLRDVGDSDEGAPVSGGVVNIQWKSSFLPEFKKNVVIHEVGHAVQYALTSTANGRKLNARIYKMYQSASKKVKEYYKQNRMKTPKNKNSWDMDRRSVDFGVVSGYAMTNEKEFFAEHYAAYVQTPRRLMRRNPEVYSAMKSVFEGKEYSARDEEPYPRTTTQPTRRVDLPAEKIEPIKAQLTSTGTVTLPSGDKVVRRKSDRVGGPSSDGYDYYWLKNMAGALGGDGPAYYGQESHVGDSLDFAIKNLQTMGVLRDKLED